MTFLDDSRSTPIKQFQHLFSLDVVYTGPADVPEPNKTVFKLNPDLIETISIFIFMTKTAYTNAVTPS